MFGDRINQLDTRIGKVFRFGRSRATLALDVLNALNSDAILGLQRRPSTPRGRRRRR